RIVGKRIGIGLVGFDIARYLEALNIENDHFFAVPVRYESLVKIFDQGHSVAALQASNGADYRPFIGIQHYDFCAVRHIDAPRIGIDCDVIKILATTWCCSERNFFQQMVTARRRACQGKRPESQERCTDDHIDETAYFHEASSWAARLCATRDPGASLAASFL